MCVRVEQSRPRLEIIFTIEKNAREEHENNEKEIGREKERKKEQSVDLDGLIFYNIFYFTMYKKINKRKKKNREKGKGKRERERKRNILDI